jgi:hypothetical protein
MPYTYTLEEEEDMLDVEDSLETGVYLIYCYEVPNLLIYD